ncbi:MAG: hypothetical protein EHM21_12525 [Chloroflexi bacterium]|nr:MAG: hypothetical protein EHM21_12525 [Chloroflexota bacterium]
MQVRINQLWAAFIRLVIGLLVVLLVTALFVGMNPRALYGLASDLPLPGVVQMPVVGPTPLPPVIGAPKGRMQRGYVAFSGESNGASFSCGFLLRLEDGRRVGISAAHATPSLADSTPAEFLSPGGARLAGLKGQIERGSAFRQDHFTRDYVLWEVGDEVGPEIFLAPDPRGAGQPGEKVLAYSRFDDGSGGSRSWPGVVMTVSPEAIWIQLEDSFNPRGFSGCPVVSQHTGLVIGMAVAGRDRRPVVMGLHPIGSLVKKVEKALAEKPNPLIPLW